MLLHFAVLPITAVVALRITLLFSRYSGNRLEKLSRDREGQYSIRINDQWRVCFRWGGGDAHGVEITDYR